MCELPQLEEFLANPLMQLFGGFARQRSNCGSPSQGSLQIACKWPTDLGKGREWLNDVEELVRKKCPANLKKGGFTRIEISGPDDSKWEAVTYGGAAKACTFVMR